MDIIRSRSNPAIKQAKKLQQRKYRKESYLIEGWHLFEEAVAAGVTIQQIFAVEDGQDRLADFPQVKWVSPEVLQDLATSPSPQGLVAQLALPEQRLPAALTGRYLVLEDVQDPGNVGTMIRTADAAGMDAVFISDQSADIFNAKTLRSMQGSHFHLPIYRLPMDRILSLLKKDKVALLATTLSDQSVDYREVEVPASYALVMGNEGQGISPLTQEQADQLVHIPMPGQAESLNVAVAAAILVFHFLP